MDLELFSCKNHGLFISCVTSSNPLLTCVSTVVDALAWQCLLGAGSLGVWVSALHEISYFIMMNLLFLLPCDFF